MRIEQVMRGCGLLVQLTPDDCYTLAAACRSAAAEHEERAKGGDELSRRGHLYDTFAAALEGYALAGAAPGYMGAQDGAQFTVALVREAWDVTPREGGAR